MELNELADARLAICKACGLYSDGICNNKKWMHPDTGVTSYLPKDGWIRGCACNLSMKVLNPKAKCPAKKW